MSRTPAPLWCTAVLLAALAVPAPARIFEVSGGISKNFNARWSESLFSLNKSLSYSIDDTDFTMIEGSICNTRTGIALGVNMDLNDNAVGKANRLAGYIGFNRLHLRYQTGSLRGTTQWSGALAPGQDRLSPFSGSITHIDLLYWREKIPMYFGLGYTAYAMPMEVKTMYTNSNIENQKSGVSFLDPDYRGEYYAFLFGFDSFTSSLLYLDSKALSDTARETYGVGKSPWGMFFVAQDRFGFGSDRISDKALAAARAMNANREPVGNSFISGYLENTTSIGVRWRGVSPYGRMVVGLGYELAFFMTMDINGGASKRGDLGMDPMSSLARHGPVARLYVQW